MQPWLASYPAKVPHTIDTSIFRNLGEFFDQSFTKNADKTAQICFEQRMSYGELDALSRRFAAWLQAQGIQPQDRVALMLPNLPQFAVCMSAMLRCGYTCVNVNPLYTARELKHQLQDSGAQTIIILENFCHTLEEVLQDTDIRRVVVCNMGEQLRGWYGRWITFAVRHLAKLVPPFKLPLQVTRGGESYGVSVTPFGKALSAGRKLSFTPPAPGVIGHDSMAFLQYTGGTTGLSKGAVLTHSNVIAAVLQSDAWFTPALHKLPDTSKSNTIAALPLYHIFALTLCFLTFRWGGHMTLVPNPRDTGKFIETLKKRPFHMLPAVNTLFNALLAHPQIKSVDFSSLVVSQAGGMAASEGTARKWQQLTGCAMIEGWGMSETAAIGTNNVVTSTQFSGHIGLPLPSVDVAIKDDDGKSLALGESGEICIKGPNVMPGYYQKPEENANAFTPDGYMRTGDIGIMSPDGSTRIVDRKKDMILVSGFNVFPSELENVISLCPGVLEVASIGVPDDKQGEAIKVFVVRSDQTLTEEEVARYCRDHLTGYKQPKYIEFRDDLPKSAVGKILRRELRTA